MDTGSKSLAQLSEEGKEKKYVTIEVGSKVSGYTKDYLERLCRLNKVEYRLRGNGAYAIELESLLRETHTILLSYEGVTFVEKSDLTNPIEPKTEKDVTSSALKQMATTVALPEFTDEVTIDNEAVTPERGFAQAIPRFGDMNRLSQQSYVGNPFSFVGRPVVSDGETPDVASKESVHIPIAPTKEVTVALSQEAASTRIPAAPDKDPLPSHPLATVIPLVSVGQEKDAIKTSSPFSREPVHIPVSLDNDASSNDTAIQSPSVRDESAEPSISPAKEKTTIEVTHGTHIEASAHDDWDSLLFQEKTDGVDSSRPSVGTTPSPYSAPKEEILPPLVRAATPSQTLIPRAEVHIPQAAALDEAVSLYRPIKTSPDASVHHDDGPLFPPLSKEPLQSDLSAISKVKDPPSFVPPPGQKVIVFDPQSLTQEIEAPKSDQKNVVDNSFSSINQPIIPRAVLKPDIPRNVSLREDEQISSPSQLPIQSSAPAYQTEKHIVPKKPLPLMRVMPQVPAPVDELLPALLSERRVLLRDERPLIAKQVLNVVFGLFIGSASLLLLGGFVSDRFGVELNSASYVASVGATKEMEHARSDQEVKQTPSAEILPFSNEVIVHTSTTSDSISITPVFKDGTGRAYQYEINGNVFLPVDTPAIEE